MPGVSTACKPSKWARTVTTVSTHFIIKKEKQKTSTTIFLYVRTAQQSIHSFLHSQSSTRNIAHHTKFSKEAVLVIVC